MVSNLAKTLVFATLSPPRIAAPGQTPPQPGPDSLGQGGTRMGPRWSVECTFFSVKTRGFDLERTGITQPARLERLFGLVILAWVACLRVGVWLERVQPIAVKVHGRKAMSLIRYGAEHLTNALRWRRDELSNLLSLITTPFAAPGAA
jgi:hypothetical protein